MTKHSEPSDFSLVDGGFRPQEVSGSVRGALRAWLGRLVADAELAEVRPDGTAQQAPRLASSFENRVRMLRADARAAFLSVEGARKVDGPDAAALDAALAVMEAEWRAAVAERDNCAEALKAIRVYAPDPRCRAMAATGLSRTRPGSSGFDRFPFIGEFDA